MAVAAGHLQSVVLGNLLPDTQYQLSVAAIYNGRRHKSRQIVFKTMGKCWCIPIAYLLMPQIPIFACRIATWNDCTTGESGAVEQWSSTTAKTRSR